MSDYISREDALDCTTGYVPETVEEFAARTIRRIKNLPPADVRPVVQIVDRLDEERKKAKGQWHTDRYWLGWADAMRRARRIVDGSIDEEPMYAPSSADEKMDE